LDFDGIENVKPDGRPWGSMKLGLIGYQRFGSGAD
jgi:hypothetical protein